MKLNHICMTLATTALLNAVSACGGVAGNGQTVSFKKQMNIVIWDRKTKIEHFIRKATFNSKAGAIGFIAPTPTTPEIREVDEAAFSILRSLNPSRGNGGLQGGFGGGGFGGKVEVVQQVEAGGYQITTVKATDANALASWMRLNRFVTIPEVTEWTKFYIKKGWQLNLFKVLGNKGYVATGTVRLSFPTENPFNPYLVPRPNFVGKDKGDGLELYVITRDPIEGWLGETPYLKPAWTSSLPDDKFFELEEKLKLKKESLWIGAVVTCFVDRAFPREVPDDLYFEPKTDSKDQKNLDNPLMAVLARL